MSAEATSPRSLRIAVMRDRYPTRFNTPRQSRHRIEAKLFLPTHRISRAIEAATVFTPLLGYDLVHAFNRIPLGPTPYIVSFESHLPRYWRKRNDAFFRFYNSQLRSDDCRAIVAISKAAAATFAKQQQDKPGAEDLMRKLTVIYPNMDMPNVGDVLAGDDAKTLRVSFVGAHFGRKGGCAAVRLAELARERGLPIHVTIVSTLQAGGKIWTDPSRPGFFDRYYKLLDAENVTHLDGAPNPEARAIMANSHFSILTTFGDTFGFSAIESMAHWTPMIATRQGALPEFIFDGENGMLIDLETTDVGEWVHSSGARETEAFEEIFIGETERIAHEMLAKLEPYIGKPELMAPMRRKARETALRMFDAREAAPLWDDFYNRAAEAPITSW